MIARFNDDNDANDELYENARLACRRRAPGPRGRRPSSRAGARKARGAWRTAQLEHHDRRGWLPLMTLIAVALLGLDSVGCVLRRPRRSAVTSGSR